MKHLTKRIVIALAGAFFVSGTCMATVPPAGKNGNVEWQQINRFELPYQPVDIVNTYDGSHTFILTDKGSVLVYDSKAKLEGSIPVNPGVTALGVDANGTILYLIDSSENITSSLAIDYVVDINTVNAPYKGAMDAPVTIAVFSDFQ